MHLWVIAASAFVFGVLGILASKICFLQINRLRNDLEEAKAQRRFDAEQHKKTRDVVNALCRNAEVIPDYFADEPFVIRMDGKCVRPNVCSKCAH